MEGTLFLLLTTRLMATLLARVTTTPMSMSLYPTTLRVSVGAVRIKSNERKTKMECEICDYRQALEVLQYDTEIAELEFVAVCQNCHDAIVCDELETQFPILDIFPIAD